MVYTVTENVEVSQQTGSEKSGLRYFCIFVGSITLLSQGLQLGWIRPVVPLQYNKDIIILPNIEPWIVSSTYLAAAVSSTVYSYLSDIFGRKNTSIFICIPQVMTWLLLLIPRNMAMLIMSRVISGFALGGALVNTLAYVNELSTHSRRGTPICFGMTFFSLGYFLMHILGTFVSYHRIIYVAISLPILQIGLICFIVETPSYLVKDSKNQEAAESLSKLKSLEPNDSKIIDEMFNLEKVINRNKTSKRVTLVNVFQNRVWRNAFKIGIILLSVRTLGGSYIITGRAMDVILRSRISMSSHVQTFTLPAILLASSFMATVLVDKCGRKILLILSSSIIAICLGILAVFMKANLTITSLHWLPLTVFVIAGTGYGLGIVAVPFVVILEITNLQIRSAVLGSLFAYTFLISFLETYFFRNLEELMGLDTLLYVYAGINLYGAVYTLFGVPETKSMNIYNIEKELKKTAVLKL